MQIWSEGPRPRRQREMIAPSLDEQIGESAGVRFLDELLEQVDWTEWEDQYHQSGPGRPTHHPRIMCAAILYGLMRGMHSTRMLEYATHVCQDFQWLLDGRTIDHSTFAKFRTRHGERLKSLFRQINRKAAQIRRLSLEEVIIDGTRVRADSDRMGSRTAGALERRLTGLEEKMSAALEGLEKAREEGRDDEVDRCERRKQVLQGRMKTDEAALAVARERDALKQAREGLRGSDVRVPVTDPDAHLLPNKEGGYAPNYTPVIAVEADSGLIVAAQISANNTETDCMLELVQETQECLGAKPLRLVADEGFGSGHELQSLKAEGIETYIPLGKGPEGNPALREHPDQPVDCGDWARLPRRAGKLARAAFVYESAQDVYYCPMGHKLSAHRKQSRRSKDGRKVSIVEYKGAPCQGCALARQCLARHAQRRVITRDEYEPCREEARARMNTARGREIYARRAPCVEGVFGTIKAAMGVRKFNRRGLVKVREDWMWTCLAFNLKKMMTWMSEQGGTKPTRAPLRGLLAAFVRSIRLQNTASRLRLCLDRIFPAGEPKTA